MATTKELTARIEELEKRLDKAAEMHKSLHQMTKIAFETLEKSLPAQLESSLTSALAQMMAQHNATMQRGASRPMQPRTDYYMRALNELRAERNLAPRAMVPMADIKARMQLLKAAAARPAETEDTVYDDAPM